MHKIHQLIRQVNKTHKGLGPLVAINIVGAKAKRCILTVAPAGCGKSAATNTVYKTLKDRTLRYDSITFASLHKLGDKFTNYDGHIIIDDLGAERSLYARLSTITTFANLVHTHHAIKETQGYGVDIKNFYGSIAMNIQPVLMNSLVQNEDWIAVVRDKTLRYYHLQRPLKPEMKTPKIKLNWGEPIEQIKMTKTLGGPYWQLEAMGLTQWSHARCLEHIPALLKACASLDDRDAVNSSDYRLLTKLLRPMQLERSIINTSGFEYGRWFENNYYCVLVELLSHKPCTIDTICEDYKIPPTTVTRLLEQMSLWITINNTPPRTIESTDTTKYMLDLIGANQKW